MSLLIVCSLCLCLSTNEIVSVLSLCPSLCVNHQTHDCACFVSLCNCLLLSRIAMSKLSVRVAVCAVCTVRAVRARVGMVVRMCARVFVSVRVCAKAKNQQTKPFLALCLVLSLSTNVVRLQAPKPHVHVETWPCDRVCIRL